MNRGQEGCDVSAADTHLGVAHCKQGEPQLPQDALGRRKREHRFTLKTHYELYQNFASHASIRSFNKMPLKKVWRRQGGGGTKIPRDKHCTRREELVRAGLEQRAAKTLRG